MTDSFVLKIFVATLSLSVAVGYLYWVKKRTTRLHLKTAETSIRLMGTLNLSMKERIVVVEFAQRHLVLALNGSQTVMLANLEVKGLDQASRTEQYLKSHDSANDSTGSTLKGES